MQIIKLAITLITLSMQSLCFATAGDVTGTIADPTDYGWYPKIVLGLGRGFNPADVLHDPKLPCIVAATESLDGGAPSTKLSVTYVKSMQGLEETAHVDAKASATAMGGSGSASYAVDAASAFNNTSISVLVSAETDYGRWGLKAPVLLTDAAKALLATPKEFERICGSRYVAVENRASSANVLITIESVSSSTKDAMDASISGGAQYGAMSATASARFSKELKTANKQSRINVRVFATGGAGQSSLANLAKAALSDDDTIKTIGEGLASFLSTFAATNAVPIGYQVASMNRLGWSPDSVGLWETEKEKKLRYITAQYNYMVNELALEQDYLNGGRWRGVYGDELVLHTRIMVSEIQAYLDELKTAYHLCQTDPALSSCDLRPLFAGGSFVTPPAPALTFRTYPRSSTAPLPNIEDQLSKLILQGGAKLTGLQNFSPTATSAAVYMQVGGVGNTPSYPLTGEILIHRDSDGTENTVVQSSPGLSESFPWTLIPEDLSSQYTLIYTLTNYFGKYSGSGKEKGTFYLIWHDKLGRTFRIAFVDYDVTVTDSKVTNLEWLFNY